MTTPITFNVNTAFIPRIVAAFRAEYPVITQGLADGPAVKAVIRQFVADTVSTYEAQQATTGIKGQVNTLSDTYQTTYINQLLQTATDTGANVT